MTARRFLSVLIAFAMLLPSITLACFRENRFSEETVFEYDDHGRLEKKTFDPGHYELNTFDSRGRLSASTLKTAGHSVMRSQSYVYDKASFVKEHTVGSNTTEYTYDDAGQLIREEKPWLTWDREYEYDGNGNRKKHIHNSTEYRYIYDPGDRLKEIQESDIMGNWYSIREFTYDAAGRMATDTEGNRGFTWDHEGRLTGLTATAGNSYNAYNGLNTRISRTATGATTFTRDGVGVTSPLMRDSAGTAYTPNISYRSGGNTKFQHYGLKNTQYETSMTPSVTADSEFDAFGDALSPFSTGGLFGYGGAYGYQSDSSSLQLLGHRWYDPTIGRFITKDPVQDGRNWYAYCDSEPVGRSDRNGLRYQVLKEVIKNGASHLKPVRDVTKRGARQVRKRGGSIKVSGQGAENAAKDLDNSVSGGTSYPDGPHPYRRNGMKNVRPMRHYQNNVVDGHTFFTLTVIFAILTRDPITLGLAAADYCDENDEEWREGVEGWYSRRGGFSDQNVFSAEFEAGQ
ncbi:MAG: hypothetical protein JNK63_08275 [Chthonomonas sp.]|nr:hypothetical protein [Chthonomonas sp.]